MVCTTAGIQIIVVLLVFTMFSLLPKRDVPPSNFWQRISCTIGCIPANKPSIASCFSHALIVFYFLKWSVEQLLTADLSASAVGAGRLLIVRSMNNNTGLTDTRTEPDELHTEGYGGWGERLLARDLINHPNCHVLTTQFADSECSNYTTCRPGRYSRFTPEFMQYNHQARCC